MIVGFEEMILRCLGGSAKSHIREAAKCYESGSYRAAIVTAYVAVCFDLIEKIKILSASGDLAAEALEKQLSKLQEQQEKDDPAAISGLLQFEKTLLENFRDKFEFFGLHEYEELSRLRHDRNRCAHPTFFKSTEPYAPSAELARLHIRNAIEYVLSQPPKQGKAAIANLQAIVLSPLFPENLQAVVARLKGAEFANPRASLIKAFVDDLCFGCADVAKPYFGKWELVCRTLNAAVEIDRSGALPRIIANVQKLFNSPVLSAVETAAKITLAIPEVARALDNPSQVMMSSWLTKATGDTLSTAIKPAIQINWLSASIGPAVKKLTSKDIERIDGELPPEIVTQAARLYASAKSWDAANTIAYECVDANVERFTKADVQLILDASQAGDADLRGSHSFKPFINDLYEKSSLDPKVITDMLVATAHDRYIPASQKTQEDPV